MELKNLSRGIVLVTGQTGSGKSTTLAALLNEINHTRPCHILTLEDPIEYQYTPDKSLINQREIGEDTVSYAQGLREALREDPDILLIGEMRDMDTIETALTAAETGHLVFSTLHTSSAADSIDRIVSVFPAERQQQVRMQLSMTLKAVLSQQLLPRIGGGRAPCVRGDDRESRDPEPDTGGEDPSDQQHRRDLRKGRLSCHGRLPASPLPRPGDHKGDCPAGGAGPRIFEKKPALNRGRADGGLADASSRRF